MAKPRPLQAASIPPAGFRDWPAVLLVAAATLLAYLPSFRGDFIWNDSDYVTAPELRSLPGDRKSVV